MSTSADAVSAVGPAGSATVGAVASAAAGVGLSPWLRPAHPGEEGIGRNGGGFLDGQLDGPAEHLGVFGEQHELPVGRRRPDDLEQVGSHRLVDARRRARRARAASPGRRCVEELARGRRPGPRAGARRRPSLASRQAAMRLLELARTPRRPRAAALSISGCRTSACACRLAASSGRVRSGSPSGRLSIGSSSASLRACRARSLMSPAVCSKALSAAITAWSAASRSRRAVSSARRRVAATGVDLGPELLGGREALHALDVLAGADRELAFEGVDRAAGELERLVAAVHLGLGGGQLALELGGAGLDGGQLDAPLLGSRSTGAARRARAGGARRGRRGRPSRARGRRDGCPTASRASASGARSDDEPGRWDRRSASTSSPGSTPRSSVARPSRRARSERRCSELGAGLGAALERLEGEGGLEVLALGGRAGGVGGRGAAAAEHHVEVATEAVLVEEGSLGGVGGLEPLAGGAAHPPAADDLLLGRQHLGVGGVEGGPLGGRDGRGRGGGVELGERGRRGRRRGDGRRRARARWRCGRDRRPAAGRRGGRARPAASSAASGSTSPAIDTACSSPSGGADRGHLGRVAGRRRRRRAERPRGAPARPVASSWSSSSLPSAAGVGGLGVAARPARRPRARGAARSRPCPSRPSRPARGRPPRSRRPRPCAARGPARGPAGAVRCSARRSSRASRTASTAPRCSGMVGVELGRPRRPRRRSCAASPAGARAGGGRCRSRASCGRPRRRDGPAAARRSSARAAGEHVGGLPEVLGAQRRATATRRPRPPDRRR